MKKKAMKNILFFLLTALYSTSLIFGAAMVRAGESDYEIIEVSESGTDLNAFAGSEAKAYAMQLVNDIENPYDLKEGSKLIVPDEEFVAKIEQLQEEGASEEALQQAVIKYNQELPESAKEEVSESYNAETNQPAGNNSSADNSSTSNSFENNSTMVEMEEVLPLDLKPIQGRDPVEKPDAQSVLNKLKK